MTRSVCGALALADAASGGLLGRPRQGRCRQGCLSFHAKARTGRAIWSKIALAGLVCQWRRRRIPSASAEKPYGLEPALSRKWRSAVDDKGDFSPCRNAQAGGLWSARLAAAFSGSRAPRSAWPAGLAAA